MSKRSFNQRGKLLIGKLPVLVLILLGISLFSNSDASSTDATLWQILRSGGHVALLRHAIAPGTGDPVGFALDECATQRNLSAEGRAQARRIGDKFRANGINGALVFSSQWCRCLETARLLALGPVQELAALNSFFWNFERRAPQSAALKGWLSGRDLDHVHVLVTHQVNISALTGSPVRSGELVIVRPSEHGEIIVIGTIETD